MKFFISFLILFFLGYPARPVDGAPSALDQVFELFSKSDILSSHEGKKLFQLVEEVQRTDVNEAMLTNLLNRLSGKIEGDQFQMQFIIESMKQINQMKFAVQVARIDEANLKNCQRMHEKLSSDVRRAAPIFRNFGEHFHKQDLFDAIHNKIIFLMDEQGSLNIPSVWREIKKAVLPVYQEWNRLYAGVNKTRIMHVDERSSEKKLLSIEERNFIQVFSRLQYALRRLAGMHSSDF